jgi:hypothetical protein
MDHLAASTLGVIGSVRVYAVTAKRRTLVLHKRNLVVNIGLSAISRLLGGNVGAPSVGGSGFSALDDIAVSSMVLGNHPSPTTPAVGDIVGVQQLVYTPSLSVSYPDDYSITFEGTIPQTDGNGLTITEEALLLRNGLLFARTTFAVPKTSAAALLFTHTISFSRA